MIMSILLIFVMVLVHSSGAEELENKNRFSGDLIVFHAGSLAVTLSTMAEQFEQEHPHVKVLCESAGSRTCARKIRELGRPCDILFSSDYSVIEELLIPEYADWYLLFAGNEMTVVFTDASRNSGKINQDNWYRLLLDDNVAFGRSDPNADPCGYRTVFVIELAEEYYRSPGLTDCFLKKDVRFIRPKEVDLLALLETGDLDYAFLYRSVARQHGLNVIPLPDEINLRNPALRDHYKKANMKISGKKPGTFITQSGDPIGYAVTILPNAPNPSTALEFVRFLLDNNKGVPILENDGFTMILPAITNDYKSVPESLKRFTKP